MADLRGVVRWLLELPAEEAKGKLAPEDRARELLRLTRSFAQLVRTIECLSRRRCGVSLCRKQRRSQSHLQTEFVLLPDGAVGSIRWALERERMSQRRPI
jgi:hypothetical protein